MPVSTPELHHQPRISVMKHGLPVAAVLFLGLTAVLVLYGLPLWQALAWGAAFGALVPLRVRIGEGVGEGLSRVAVTVGPLIGFTLVEQLNYNTPWRGFTPAQIFLNLGFYYLVAVAAYLLLGRRTLSAGAAMGFYLLLGLVNRYVIRFRGRTIFPGDLMALRTAANVAKNYDYSLDLTQVGCVLAALLFCLLLTKLPPRKGRRYPHLRLTVALAVLWMGFVGAFFLTDVDKALGVEPSMWTTRGNGFVLNFMVCLKYSTVDPPEGYSPEALDEIVRETPPRTPLRGQTVPENIVVIMNESYADLSVVGDLPVNQDWMPFYRSLTENTVKGTAYVSVFGGTTANSEYEFLTGNTTAFLPEGTVPFHMYVKEGSPSLVGQLRGLGYSTLAMHPYYASGWNRVPVYRDLGFEQSLFQGDFQNPSYMRDYITDQSNYENLIARYEAREQGSPFFVFNVTMQNHSAYNVAWKGLPRTVELTGDMAGRYPTVDQYLSLMKQSDLALEYLLDYFAQVEEPTLVLLFGDHQPQVSTSFYTKMLGGQFEGLEVADQQRRQAVPFLLWANYDIPEEEGLELSLNYLSTLLLDTAGLPTTGYQDFLRTLRQSVPAVNALGFQGAGGAWAERREELTQAQQALLLRYEMLQYNQLFDESEGLEGFFALEP